MNPLLNYSIFFIIYGYILLLLLKGYYPANETGILFIGFLIFMTLAYKFMGALITSELDSRRKEIYNKLESLSLYNFNSLIILKDLYQDIISYEESFYEIEDHILYLYGGLYDLFEEMYSLQIDFQVDKFLIENYKREIQIHKNVDNVLYLLSASQLKNNRAL
jgi:hypothetical protein